jgi:hypothetical protein
MSGTIFVFSIGGLDKRFLTPFFISYKVVDIRLFFKNHPKIQRQWGL